MRLREFTPPDLAGLTALPMGMTALKSEPGGLALDFVRVAVDGEPMITKAADDSVAEGFDEGEGIERGGCGDTAAKALRWRMRW